MSTKVEPILFSIDTNVFNQKTFDFSHIIFQSLKKKIKNSSIKILMVDVIEYEIKEQIRKNIEQANKELQTVLKTKSGRFIKNEVTYSAKDHINKLQEGFKSFLEETKAISVPTSNVRSGEVLSLYFNTNPPFGKKEIKKHEFPDAYICLSLKNYAEKNKRIIHVISQDKGIIEFCEENDCFFKHFKSLDVFLDYVNKIQKQKNYEVITDYLIENLDIIKKEISDKVSDQMYILDSDYADSDVEDVTAEQVEIEEVNIIDFDDITAEINILCKAKLLVDFTYAPDEAIFYDSEDKVNYYMEHIPGSLEIEESIPVYLELNIEDLNNINIDHINVEQIDDVIQYYEDYEY